MATKLSMITEQEEHSFQFASKRKASIAASIETQRTGVKHTHFLVSTWRNLTERVCWAVIPVRTARQQNEGLSR